MIDWSTRWGHLDVRRRRDGSVTACAGFGSRWAGLAAAYATLTWTMFFSLGLFLGVGGEDAAVYLRVELGWITLTVGLRNVFPASVRRAARAWAERNKSRSFYAYDIDLFAHPRETGVSVDDSIQCFVWCNYVGVIFSTPKRAWPWLCGGWSGSWNWLDALAGPVEYTHRVHSWATTCVILGGRSIPLRVGFVEAGWRRRIRWASPYGGRLMHRAQVSVAGHDLADPERNRWSVDPPTFAGKGESGWDLDDDAIDLIITEPMPEPWTASTAAAAYVAAYQDAVPLNRSLGHTTSEPSVYSLQSSRSASTCGLTRASLPRDLSW